MLINVLAIGHRLIYCSDTELVTITPPFGQTCEQYMSTYISYAGGYLTDPEATNSCSFCSVRTTDQFVAGAYNIYYSHHWRDMGIMMSFIVFNVSDSTFSPKIELHPLYLQIVAIFLLTYLFRIRTGSLLPQIFRRSAAAK